MRRVCHCVQTAGLVLLLTGAAAGQAILEHAMSAAGGSAAGLAGKPISDGIDKIFRKLDKQADQAAASGQLEQTRKQPVTLIQKGISEDPAGFTALGPRATHATGSQARLAGHERDLSGGSTAWSGEIFGAMRMQPTRDELAGIEGGTDRSGLIARLGQPSARVFIPEEGQLREVYYFSGDGQHLGTVELSDGVVEVVNVR